MDIVEEIKKTLTEGLEEAEVHVLENDGVHLEAVVISPSFRGHTLVKQHQMVKQLLKEHFATTLHALSLKTYTPEGYDERTKNHP